jgi:hypothetical protein
MPLRVIDLCQPARPTGSLAWSGLCVGPSNLTCGASQAGDDVPIPVSDKELEDKFGLLAAMLGGNEQMKHGMMGLQFEDALAVMARESNLSVATLKEALAKLSAEELAAHAKLMLEQTQQSAHALEEADVYTDALEDAFAHLRFVISSPRKWALVPRLCWSRFEHTASADHLSSYCEH